MTIETISKRIEGKQKEIQKLEKKMERILKAQEYNWENNPYWYSERDIRITSKELETAKKALEDYQQMLISETEKANSRNIQVIIDFLDMWKARVRDYHSQALPIYLQERADWYEFSHQYTEWFNSRARWDGDPEEVKARNSEYRKVRLAFESKWKWLVPYLNRDSINYEKLDKDLQREADAKYDFIIERTNSITGTITDASNLRIGAKGDLNGFIIGERGTAKVETIGAGGYNIQCYHFRTLIHEMK